MRRKNTTGRVEKISGRISTRARLGAELLGNRYGVSLSTVLEKGIEALMAREGLAGKEPGELSVMDRALAMQPGARTRWIAENHPQFLSEADRVWMASVLIYEDHEKRALTPSELETHYEEQWGAFE